MTTGVPRCVLNVLLPKCFLQCAILSTFAHMAAWFSYNCLCWLLSIRTYWCSSMCLYVSGDKATRFWPSWYVYLLWDLIIILQCHCWQQSVWP